MSHATVSVSPVKAEPGASCAQCRQQPVILHPAFGYVVQEQR
jgi:hypothetical protein